MLRKHWLGVLGCWAVLAAVAVAAPPHTALIVDGQNGHDWKATTPVLKKLLEETGLFAVDVATSPPKGEDMSGFQPNFAAYDVVISNYQGDPWPEETQKALVDYVSGGGGLVIYHFACAAFPDWKEYNEMIALGGWGKRDETAGPMIRLRDGKFVRDTSDPRRAGDHGPAQEFQIVRSPSACPRNSLTVRTSCTAGFAARPRTSPCWLPPSPPRARAAPTSMSRCCSPSSTARAACSKTRWGTPPNILRAWPLSPLSSEAPSGSPPAR